MSSRIAEIQGRILSLQGQQATAVAERSPSAGTVQNTGTVQHTGFAGHLSRAVESALGRAPAEGTYRLNSRGIPVELAGYGNGRIPADALHRVGDSGHRLWAPAAGALSRMIEDAARDGVVIGISDAYRSYEEQVGMARRKGLYSQGGLAAKPGTSEHGWGMAADLDLNGKALSWMRRHAGEYGFVENVPRESWHWAYRPRG